MIGRGVRPQAGFTRLAVRRNGGRSAWSVDFNWQYTLPDHIWFSHGGPLFGQKILPSLAAKPLSIMCATVL